MRTKGLNLALVALVATLGLLAACTQAATPTPTTAPAKPAATATTAAKPTAAPASKPAATPAAKPKESAAAKPATGTQAKPAAAANWKEEWDKTVAAAKKEGTVAVAGAPGTGFRDGVAGFQKAYPGIKLEYTGQAGSQFAPKVIAERDGGQFLWDVHMGGGTTMNSRLNPKKALAPLRPALILPEVLDDSKWLNGFEAGWADNDRQRVYQFTGYLNRLFRVNRDFVPESELSNIDQLLEPKWKGKIISQDLRAPGPSGTSVGWLLLNKGEEWLRKFYAQDIVIVKDGRSQMEGVVRGRYPVAYGGSLTDLLSLQREGVGKNVVDFDPNNPAAMRLTGGFGFIALMDKAPHPNAAKVFINYMLAREAQQLYADSTGDNSRRLDVKGAADTAPDPKVQYRSLEREDLYPNVQKGNAIAKEMIK